jgi:hypothetical protein
VTVVWFVHNYFLILQRLYRERIIDATPDQLRSRYLQKIMHTLSSLEIDVPVVFDADMKRWELQQALPWNVWDSATRRTSVG